jgi:hypothetical protein
MTTSENDQNKNIPKGFGKDIHDYLCHYVDIADTKAAVIIGVSSGFIGFLLTQKVFGCLTILLWSSLVFLAICIVICLFAVMPRLYSGGKSLIFWEDIFLKGSFEKYIGELEAMTHSQIEKEYATQNFYLSHILHKKYAAIRLAFHCFSVAVLLALPILIINLL